MTPDDRDADRGIEHDPDELDCLIDALLLQGDAGDGAPTDEVASVLGRVAAMAHEPVPQASRARHLATIRTVQPAAAPARARRAARGRALRVRRGLVPVGVLTAALVLLAGGGTVALAQDAGPDDLLYPVKRGSEQVWLALPRGPERAAEAHLAVAARRIGEAHLAPDRADGLVAAGVTNAEAASDEKPEEALETFARLLGTGPDALPAQASPRARAALYRNCVRIAEKHGLDHACPEPADAGAHPGRGAGPPDHARGWGPGGRPEGEVGPPPHARGWGPGGRPEGEVGPPPHARGWGPGGRPEGEVGPPPHARGWGPGGRPEGHVGPPPGVPGRGPAPDQQPAS